MSNFNIENIGLLVGLEIHQQLLTKQKLFCSCKATENNHYKKTILRRLKASKSELGQYDPSALFENVKSKAMIYYTTKNSCLVEEDEEPPHNLNSNAKDISIIIASNLNSNIFNETYVMRKIVVDGSNTTGFQRTILISQGGSITVNQKKINIQTICLEEDAARLLNDQNNVREYSLDRLGIPLIEIVLEPINTSPADIRKIAFSLGRSLRVTKKVKRGIGTIRQDVNISIKGGNVVEVKGIQNLDQLEKVVEYEARRQYSLLMISKILKKIDPQKITQNDIYDMTDLINLRSNEKLLKNNFRIKLIKLKNFSGMLKYKYNGISIENELNQVIRFFGMDYIFCSDNLPNKEIDKRQIECIKNVLKICSNDGFVILIGSRHNIDVTISYLVKRIEDSKSSIPSETRMATLNGKTLFLRPKSGASRMYPETDILPIIITKEEIKTAKNDKFMSWDESIICIKKKYNINSQLAEQIFDSNYLNIFESICSNKKHSPNFVASILCSTITKLQREGLNLNHLINSDIIKVFDSLADNIITNEAIEIIFRNVMTKKTKSITEIIKKISINQVNMDTILDSVVNNNRAFIQKERYRAINALMGLAMKALRGKTSGKIINQILQKKIDAVLYNND